MDLTRRTMLSGSVGALSASLLAGCLEEFASENDGVESGYAAFYPLWDWSERVSGDVATFENPIDADEMGHGWEPETGLTADIAETDAFVYLDSAEFSWAQETAATLEADYDHVAVIDVLEAVEGQLIGWDEDGHEGHDDHEDDDHDDHDHEDDDFDPHMWLDPVLAMDIVEAIADGLADVDPDNADVFAENADAYADELAALDEEFQAVVDEAEHDAAVLASHDSFRYIERRYGFELHTPTGVSPDEEPSHAEIAETIEFVEDRGIDVILYDVFESSRLAESIVAESSATEMMPLTPLASTTSEWEDEGWRYVDQMQEINISAFREALGAPSQ